MIFGKPKPIICVINGSHPHARGLVAIYPFYEKGGGALHNLKKNNQGTLTNFTLATDWQKGAIGNCLRFTTTASAKVTLGLLNLINMPHFTASFWINYANGTTAADGAIFSEGSNASATPYLDLYMKATSGYTQMTYRDDASVTNNCITALNLKDNLWHLVVFTRNVNVWKIWVDGFERATVTQVLGTATVTQSTFGCLSRQTDAQFYNDTIGEARFYNRCLTQREIQEIYTHPWDVYYTPKMAISQSLTPPILPTIVSGNNQSAIVSTALTNPLAINVTQDGVDLGSETITWSVTAGSGTLGNSTTVTDASGNTSNTYTPGAAAGTNTVRATTSDGNYVDFTATGTTNFKAMKIVSLDIGGPLSVGKPKGNLLPITVVPETPVGEPPGDLGIVATVSGSTAHIYVWNTNTNTWVQVT